MLNNVKQYRGWSIVSYGVTALAAAFVVGVAAIAYFLGVKFENVTQSELVVHSSVPSPDGKRAAVIYEMEGGATAPINTQVSIAPGDTPFSPKKNPPFLAIQGQHDLAVRWISDKTVEVAGVPLDITIYKKDVSAGDVTVEYR